MYKHDLYILERGFEQCKELKFFLQIGPKCLTIQEQVDLNEAFNDRYITFNHETYVTASGDYNNDTVNIGASVELNCFYGPSMRLCIIYLEL